MQHHCQRLSCAAVMGDAEARGEHIPRGLPSSSKKELVPFINSTPASPRQHANRQTPRGGTQPDAALRPLSRIPTPSTSLPTPPPAPTHNISGYLGKKRKTSCTTKSIAGMKKGESLPSILRLGVLIRPPTSSLSPFDGLMGGGERGVGAIG
jgi:hypothetical protein